MYICKCTDIASTDIIALYLRWLGGSHMYVVNLIAGRNRSWKDAHHCYTRACMH